MKELRKLLVSIILLFILIVSMYSCNTNSDRDKYNMVLIEDGYCYNDDTKIIYTEYINGRDGRTSYSVYLSENGNPYRYNTNTGKWEEIIKENTETGVEP